MGDSTKIVLSKNDGGILIDDGDLRNYILWSLFVFFLMTATYYMWYTVFTKCYDLKRYHYSNTRDRYMYLQVWASNCHHILLVTFVIFKLFNPDCGPKSYPFQVFHDD